MEVTSKRKISKAGDKEFWYTTSELFVTINRDDGRKSRWVAFDDKGNYLGNFDKGSIKTTIRIKYSSLINYIFNGT